MNTWIDAHIAEYYDFLKAKTVARELESGWTLISTPFLGLFNDTLELYCQRENGKILLSDDGYTLRQLELCGVSLTRSPKRKEILDGILLNYGVQIIADGELRTEATERNFAQKKHNMLTAMSEISDMYVMAKPMVSAVFKEDVRAFLDKLDIVYTPHFIARGGTGLEFTFDFQIAGKGKEIVMKSFNNMKQLHLSNFLFGWEDVKETRARLTGKSLQGLAVINDEQQKIKAEYLEALTSKGAGFMLWSERYTEESRAKLHLH